MRFPFSSRSFGSMLVGVIRAGVTRGVARAYRTSTPRAARTLDPGQKARLREAARLDALNEAWERLADARYARVTQRRAAVKRNGGLRGSHATCWS